MKKDFFTKFKRTDEQVNSLLEYGISKKYLNHSQFEIHDIEEAVKLDHDLSIESHIHAFYLIVWFEKGVGKHIIDFKEYNVTNQSVFFVSPGQIHRFLDVEGYKGYSIVFTEDFLYAMSDMLRKFVKNEIFGAYKGSSICYINDVGLSERVKTIFYELKDEYETAESLFGHRDRLALLLSDLIISLRREGMWNNQTEDGIAKRDYTHYLNFVDNVEKNFQQIHDVKTYANELHISIGTLNKSIANICGKRPIDIINERLVLEAKRLLYFHSELKVKQVAGYLGFTDVSNFVKFFKHNTGMRPTDYRELD